MSEETVISEVEISEMEQIEKIKKSLDNITNKKSKFLFCVPESQSPVASIYEIYFHATTVKKMGYDVIIMVENDNYVVPVWIEKELTDFKHMAIGDPKLMVGPEDIMVIPEVYSNVMEATKKLPCVRIGFLQSIDYMMNGLIPGTDWSSFGITDIITTSQTLKEIVETYYVNKFNIQTYNVGIPDYFEKSKEPQKPIISVIGRNPNEISKLVKLFYNKYPQYSWVTFDPMVTKSKPPQPMRRVDFAKRLQENFAAIWVDRIASLGTFPLECMKSGVVPICMKPDIMPEYMIERNQEGAAVKAVDGAGVWTENFYELPILVGDVLIKFLDDIIPQEIYDTMENLASKYTQKDSEIKLMEIYQGFIDRRIELFNSAIEQK